MWNELALGVAQSFLKDIILENQERMDSCFRRNEETGGNVGMDENEGKVGGYPVKLGMTR